MSRPVPARATTALRRAVLAFALRESTELADLTITDAAVHLPGGATVPWHELEFGCPPGRGRYRAVARWLRLRAAIAALLATAGPDVLLARVRPLALPLEHPVTPGEGWASQDVLGGALSLGLALRHVDDDGRDEPDALGVLPLGVLRGAGVDPEPLVAQAGSYLRQMAAIAAERLIRTPRAPLRPVADCDVVTLLAAPTFRAAVVHDAVGVVGLRCAAVPDRRRGWLDLGRVDPAFVRAVAALTEPDRRAFSRPLLVTADEVVQVRAGGDPVRHALTDPLGPDHVEPMQRLR